MRSLWTRMPRWIRRKPWGRSLPSTVAQGNSFPSGSTRDVSLAAVQTSWTEFSDVKSFGFYVQQQVDWKDRLYRSEGVLNQDWRRLGGGDGFLSIPDTIDGRTIYAESQYLGLT